MNCSKTQPRLADYSSGRCSPRETAAIAAHLDGCPPCRRVLKDEAEVLQALSGLPRQEPGRNLWADVSRRLEAAPQRSSAGRWPIPRPRSWAWSLSAAAMAGAAWLGVMTSRPVAPSHSLPPNLAVVSPRAQGAMDDPLAGQTDALVNAVSGLSQD